MHNLNQTTITEFILLGITGSPFGVRIFFFILFLFIYMVTLMGNVFIIVLISSSNQLRSPMYFFLRNVSLCEILLTTVIVPHILDNLLSTLSLISINHCFIQFYLMCATIATECFLFSVMSYDRYLAICKPLYYFSLMNQKLCHQLGFLCWLSAYLIAIMTVSPICTLQFCGPNVIDHFFCDLIPLLELSCSDIMAVQREVFIFSFPIALFPFVFIVSTYLCIITTILKMPMAIKRKKAFSTCSAHLTVVSVYYGTLIIMYVIPSKLYSFNASKFFSLLYSVITPLLNPIIYTLRNQEILVVMKKYVLLTKQWTLLTCQK